MRLEQPRIMIVKLSAIGDVVHTLPALNALRHYYPHAHITWLVEETAADLIIGHPALDRVLVSRRKSWARGLRTRRWRSHIRQIRDFIQALRDTRYDMVLDFQAALKGALLIAMVRAHRKIGFGPGMEHQEHSYLVLNEKVPMVDMEIHALDRGLHLLESIGIPHRAITYDLPIDAAARQTARELLAVDASQPNQIPVAINPVAAWETKLWPTHRFAEVADRLIQHHNARVYFTGSRDDRRLVEQIMAKMQSAATNLAGQTTLKTLAALYQHMACVITTDTGPMHIAAAVQTPVVALFGPTAEWRTGPYGPGHHVVATRMDCRPCFKRTCEKPRCMLALTAQEVIQHAALAMGAIPKGR